MSIRKITNGIITWVAFDKTEFSSYDCCKEYEFNNRKEFKLLWDKIPKSNAHVADCFLWCGGDYDEFFIIRPRNISDIYVILSHCGFNFDVLTESDINTLVYINQYDGEEYYKIPTGFSVMINNIIKEERKMLKELKLSEKNIEGGAE